MLDKNGHQLNAFQLAQFFQYKGDSQVNFLNFSRRKKVIRMDSQPLNRIFALWYLIQQMMFYMGLNLSQRRASKF